MVIRKATWLDLPAIESIYSDIHTAEELGTLTIGWKRDIYPTAETAKQALDRNDLFVQEDGGQILGTGIINQQQVDIYYEANWQYPATDSEVMVLHTLVISPGAARKGYGRSFVAFYEDFARSNNCRFLRLDTNERNRNARALYKKLGYREIGIFPVVFNGLKDVRLVLLEKKL